VDVFYVKDIFGLKVENERRLQQLREALLAALANPDDTTTEPVTPPKRRRAAAGN
jgi:[protein-PII] uridylyltransferase